MKYIQALESGPRVAKAASDVLLRQRPSVGTAGGTTSRKRGDGRTGPMEGVAETLYQIRSVAKKLRPKEIRESLDALRTEAVNVVSRCARVRLVLPWATSTTTASERARAGHWRRRALSVTSLPCKETR